MALSTSIASRTGVIAQYVRIVQVINYSVVNTNPMSMPVAVDADVLAPRTTIFFELWLDRERRELAKSGRDITPLARVSLQTLTLFADLADAYVYLKTLPEFDGAQDC